ncbi:MAG: hypothetical protein EOP49_04530, partial [Sphingobacteriales bacterium]
MHNKQLRKRWMFVIVLLVIASMTKAQQWNPNHKIGTVTGNYHFAPGQTPDQLVEIFPAAIPNTGLTYQWYSSAAPTTGFTAIGGATGANYSWPGSPAFSQTMYVKRVTTSGALGQLESNVVKLNFVSANWEDINYIREHDVKVTGITTWQAVDQLAIGSKLQVTSYMDGLGRSTQNVSKGTATPSSIGGAWGDMVQFSEYDQYGRSSKTFLPYTTNSQPGKFKTSTATEQPLYYTTKYNETAAFSSTVFDNSPLNRPMNVKKPGTLWAAGTGISAEYDLNVTADDVQIFTIDYSPGSSPIRTGAYPPYSLYKTVSIDENGKKTIEYADKAGRTILKKVQLDDVPLDAWNGWICTYSIFDHFGALRCQILPEGVKYLAANSWSFSGTNGAQVLAEQCYQYFYDEKGRLIWKKAQGAQPLTLVYDSRDRIAFMQDGNQASLTTPQWTANIYDDLDRILVSLLYNTTQTATSLRSSVAGAAAASSVTIANPGNTGGGASITLNTSINALTSTDLNNTTTSTVLFYQFYDNYTFSGVRSFNTNYTNLTAYSTADPNVIPIAASGRVYGLPTGKRIRVLGTNSFLSSTQYYDEKNKLIQSLEDNIKAGVDIATSQYHFNGSVLSECVDHTASGGYTNYKVLTKFIFDIIGRVTSTQKQFGSNPLKTFYSFEYNDIGQLKTKRIDPGYIAGGNADLESLNFSYNIHGKLTGINKDYALKTPGVYNKWEHFFGMYLGFDNADNIFANANQLGQVTGQLWNTQGDDAQRRFDYTYDNAGRLVNAVFKEKKKPGDTWLNTTMDFSVNGNSGKITYDLNSNLLNMLQKGVMPGVATPEIVDNLSYVYAPYSSRLEKVTDNMLNTAVNGQFGDFKDGSNGASADYVYDANGNVVIDLNKNAKDYGGVVGANGIKYNFLDKPEQIRIAGKGTIQIVYSAEGEKLQRSFTPEPSGPVITTSYASQFVYQESSSGGGLVLQYINFEEGRMRAITPVSQATGTLDALTIDGNIDLPNSKRGVFDFYVMDYLQNVRMVLTEEAYYAKNTCTMETGSGRNTIEEPIFGQSGAGNEVSSTRLVTPGAWSTNSSTYVSR